MSRRADVWNIPEFYVASSGLKQPARPFEVAPGGLDRGEMGKWAVGQGDLPQGRGT